jgi:glycosyl hydrolase family 2/HEAT repeat protein
MSRKSNKTVWWITIGVCLITVGTATAGDLSAVKRRSMVLEIASIKPANSVELLTENLKDDNMLVRRAAARTLIVFGKPAQKGLVEGMRNSDALVRMICLTGLKELGMITTDALVAGVKDKDILVRERTKEILSTIRPYPKEVTALLSKGGKSKDGFPFFRDAPLLQNRSELDLLVNTIDTIPLPLSGWKLKAGPNRIGLKEKWYEPAFRDDNWNKIEIGKFWGDCGKNYIGIAWYRGTFKLPAKPVNMGTPEMAAEIAFGAVDESAWVWINGVYVGQHDVGPHGWNKPFKLDVTDMLKWGKENQITVRVLNVGAAGGIWKPVNILIQKAVR